MCVHACGGLVLGFRPSPSHLIFSPADAAAVRGRSPSPATTFPAGTQGPRTPPQDAQGSRGGHEGHQEGLEVLSTPPQPSTFEGVEATPLEDSTLKTVKSDAVELVGDVEAFLTEDPRLLRPSLPTQEQLLHEAGAVNRRGWLTEGLADTRYVPGEYDKGIRMMM